MKLNYFGEVMGYDFRHHGAIRKISANISA
jgi:hypothetical protein